MVGDRYYIEVMCPECGLRDMDVYFAPTCGFVDWECKCGNIVDLVEYTGITEEMASNKEEMQSIIDTIERR